MALNCWDQITSEQASLHQFVLGEGGGLLVNYGNLINFQKYETGELTDRLEKNMYMYIHVQTHNDSHFLGGGGGGGGGGFLATMAI